MGIFTIQNDFTHGQLDKTLVQRSDITLYKKAAARLENVIVLPEGGAQRRFGLDLFDPSIRGNADEMIMTEFRFSVDENYLLLFNPKEGLPELRIYRDAPTGIPPLFNPPVLIFTGFGPPGLPPFPFPWDPNELKELRFTQTTNLMIITHPNVKPHQLFRGATDADWTLEDVAFSFVPVHDFVKGSYDTQKFTLSAQPMTLKVDAGTFVFTEAFVGGAFIAPGKLVTDPIGYAEITGFISSIKMSIKVISPFISTTQVYEGKDVVVAEKAWGDLEADGSGDRGWPKSCSFYQDRLWMGGARSLPQTMFGSKVDDFIDFAPRTGQDDDAINYELQSNFINPIEHLVGDRDFQIFTETSEWTPRQALDAPITPKSLSVHKHSSNGIDPTVRPVTLDNTTFFVKRGGRGVMSFGLTVAENGLSQAVYQAQDISVLSTDVIRQPVDSTTLRGFTRNNADYVLLVNGDGTLAIYQTLRSQNVSAWTIAQTNTEVFDNDPKVDAGVRRLAPFKRIQSVGEESVYCIVERNINGETRPSLEKINFDHLTDSTITQSFLQPTSLITNLQTLIGQFVEIRGSVDGSDKNMLFLGRQTVTPEGTVDISEGVPPTVTVKVKKAEVGLGFTPLIETLPIVIDTQEGALNYIPKHVNRVFIAFFESLGIRVNGVLLPNLEFNDKFLPEPVGENLQPSGSPQSGVFQFFEAGWEIQPTFTITQNEPLPMTILAIGYEVNT